MPKSNKKKQSPAQGLTHLDSRGEARMVDVGRKPETHREAIASGAVLMGKKTLDLIKEGALPKGDVLAVARVAGIMAAKNTPHIIPLCHPIPLTSVGVELKLNPKELRVDITATVRTLGRTGVEMEALTAVSAAALAVYDMCKTVDKGITITDIRLFKKTGGRSGR